MLNNAAVGGVVGVPGMAAYVAAKHAVVGLTRAAALEYAEAGVRVNAFLLSGDAAFITGAALAVDGGFTAS